MSYEFVIDSYAWIEYFRGTPAGKAASKYTEADLEGTSALTLAELREKYLRESWDFFEEDLKFMTTGSSIVLVDRSIALLAGEINLERRQVRKGWGLADSIILSTARIATAKVVTGDRHFEGLPDVIMV